jgi:hypothetical protein
MAQLLFLAIYKGASQEQIEILHPWIPNSHPYVLNPSKEKVEMTISPADGPTTVLAIHQDANWKFSILEYPCLLMSFQTNLLLRRRFALLCLSSPCMAAKLGLNWTSSCPGHKRPAASALAESSKTLPSIEISSDWNQTELLPSEQPCPNPHNFDRHVCQKMPKTAWEIGCFFPGKWLREPWESILLSVVCYLCELPKGKITIPNKPVMLSRGSAILEGQGPIHNGIQLHGV